MKTNTIPVGEAVLGRVLNARGEPIDHKDELDHPTRVPLYTLDVRNTQLSSTPPRLLETGIKVIDLMAPVFYGSTIGMIAKAGLGWLVVAEEIMNTLITRHQTIPIIVGMSETAYEASNLYEMVRDIEAEDRVVTLFEQATGEDAVRQQLLSAALTIAAHFADAGREVLLISDQHLITQKSSVELQRFSAEKGIVSIALVPLHQDGQPANNDILKTLDVLLTFSQTRAQQGLWPAIDPLASHSSLFESDAVSEEHRTLAQRTRTILGRYYELRASKDNTMLSEDDQRILLCGERIDHLFSQPFTVAEAYTDLPGVYMRLEETISSFRDLQDLSS